jgi:streptogramin lyase
VANLELNGVQEIDLDTGEVSQPALVGDPFSDQAPGHIDLATDNSTPGIVWAVSGATGQLWRIDQYSLEEGTFAELIHDRSTGEWSDVAASDGLVWLLDDRSSSVTRYDPTARRMSQIVTLTQDDINEDLAVGEGYVWVANGDTGTVLRIDPATGHVSDPLLVGGDYAAIATGEGAVWVLAVDDGGVGSLFEIDPETIRVLDRLTVAGDPADIVVADGSVWVTNNDTDTLTQIDLVQP